MLVQQFLLWVQTADVGNRIEAVTALSHAYLEADLPFEEKCAADAALTMLLDDPSPKVRAAMSEVFSLSPAAPAHIITSLACDQYDVAAPVLARSTQLEDSTLVDLAGIADKRTLMLIADRPKVSVSVTAAIGEVGPRAVCVKLLENSGAKLLPNTFRRIAERFGAFTDIRNALLSHVELPACTRELVVAKTADHLTTAPFIKNVLGDRRAERLSASIQQQSIVHVLDNIEIEHHEQMIRHLISSNKLTTGLLIRLAAHGKIEFLAAAISSLTPYSEERVQSILIKGRGHAVTALLAKASLAKGTHTVITAALAAWRKNNNVGPQEISWNMLLAVSAEPVKAHDNDDLYGLVKSIYLDTLRENAKAHAHTVAEEAQSAVDAYIASEMPEVLTNQLEAQLLEHFEDELSDVIEVKLTAQAA